MMSHLCAAFADGASTGAVPLTASTTRHPCSRTAHTSRCSAGAAASAASKAAFAAAFSAAAFAAAFAAFHAAFAAAFAAASARPSSARLLRQ